MEGYGVINFAPFIKYPKNSNYEIIYPKLTEYLKNKLPNVANIPKITDAIQEFTQLPLNQIQNNLQWGERPELKIAQLDNYPGCDPCSENTIGHFSENSPEKIFLDIDYVNQLENGNLIVNDNDAAIFFIGTTVLHELVHYGEFNNSEFNYLGEEGVKFEINVYGQNVQPDNARLILNKLN